MLKRTLVLALMALSLSGAASARVRRDRPHENKIFAANHDSVRLENEAADTMGAFRFMTQVDVDAAVDSGELLSLRGVCVDKRLPYNRRYALPSTVTFMEQLTIEFSQVFHGCPVVDSAIRSADVQKKLARRNHNAAPAYGEYPSSHERGTTLDISKHLTKEQYHWLILRLFYYREIGRILVIQERNCFHIFVKG